jgi:carbonic anhydrase/acetyltransferase-like protein (isoleucine patch superfamily)
MQADGPIWALDGVAPTIADGVWVAPTATVIGNVHLAEGVGIWWHCVLRGDTNAIRVGARTNIQDGTIVHVNAEKFACLIGNDVTIGHACIIHACTLHDRAFVGMGATVLDGAVIEEGGMLGACGLLTPGKRIGPNELWTGSPARLLRVMSSEERANWNRTAVHYAELAQRYRVGLTPVR